MPSHATQRIEQVAEQLNGGRTNGSPTVCSTEPRPDHGPQKLISLIQASWTYGSEEEAMQKYMAEGTKRAYEIGNRGPIRYDANGNIHPDILEAYWVSTDGS